MNKEHYLKILKIVTVFLGVGMFNCSFAESISSPPVFWNQETSSGYFSGREGGSFINFNDKIFVIGGSSKNILLNDVWSSADGVNWLLETNNSSWSPRVGHSVVSSGKKLFLFGGAGANDNYFNDAWSSVDGKNWKIETVNAAWSARTHASAVYYSGKIWLFGGLDASGYKNDIWSSADGINWKEEVSNASWSPRSESEIVIFNNKLFLLGGQAADGRANDVWSSADGINWIKEINDAPWFGTFGISATVSADKIFLFTAGERFNSQNDLWFSSDGKNWDQETAIFNFPFVFGFNLSLVKNNLLVNGGINQDGGFVSNPYSYIISGNKTAVLSGQSTGAYNTPDVGTDKSVPVSGLTLSGPLTSDYVLSPSILSGEIKNVTQSNPVLDGMRNAFESAVLDSGLASMSVAQFNNSEETLFVNWPDLSLSVDFPAGAFVAVSDPTANPRFGFDIFDLADNSDTSAQSILNSVPSNLRVASRYAVYLETDPALSKVPSITLSFPLRSIMDLFGPTLNIYQFDSNSATWRPIANQKMKYSFSGGVFKASVNGTVLDPSLGAFIVASQ